MQDLAAAAGLPRKRLHDLRHGAASLQIAAGIDLAVASKRPRHSSCSITADTYTHLLEGVGGRPPGRPSHRSARTDRSARWRCWERCVANVQPTGRKTTLAPLHMEEGPGQRLCAARDSNPGPAD